MSLLEFGVMTDTDHSLSLCNLLQIAQPRYNQDTISLTVFQRTHSHSSERKRTSCTFFCTYGAILSWTKVSIFNHTGIAWKGLDSMEHSDSQRQDKLSRTITANITRVECDGKTPSPSPFDSVLADCPKEQTAPDTEFRQKHVVWWMYFVQLYEEFFFKPQQCEDRSETIPWVWMTEPIRAKLITYFMFYI